MAKILLVEDDNNLREIYEARLQAEGYTIVSANDGEAALVVAKNEKPDLIISDVMMPKISGFEMLDILRNTDGLKDVKVIMLTALGQADDQARADKLGADRYLVKSQVTLEDIVKVSHELLEGSAPAVATPVTPEGASDTPAPTKTEAATPEPVVTPISVATPPAEPTATPEAVTTPPTPSTEPAVDSVVTPSVGDGPAQSSAQEKNDVQKQIQDFVDKQPTAAPTPAEPTPAATPEPATPLSTPSAEPPTPPAEPATVSTTNQAASDQMLSDAVDDLVANAEPKVAPATVEPPAADPAPAQVAEADTPATPNDSAPVAHKKIIQPIGTPDTKSDLDALVAAEEAKEPAGTEPAEPVVGDSQATDPAEQPSGEPVPPQQPGSVVKPQNEPGFDPNNIAL